MSNPSSARFQFSLRRLLVLVAVVAIVLGLFSFRAGQALAIWLVIVVLYGVVPTLALVGAVFARGDWRAFALGALVASLQFVFEGTGPRVHGLPSASWAIGSQLMMVALCGGIAVMARRWLVFHKIADKS